MLSTLKRVMLAALDSHSEDREAELLRLRAATGSLPRTWARILNANQNLTGFEFRCACSIVYTLLDWNLLLVEKHTCHCGQSFGLLRDLNLQKTPPHQWWKRFAELPVKSNAAAQQPSRFRDTWNEGNDGDVIYDGTFSQGRN